MSWNDPDSIPASDVTAGQWILTHDTDDGDEPVQLLYRTVERLPDGQIRWSFVTSAGLRRFDYEASVDRVTRAD